MAFKVIPYRAGSRGATELATALGGRCLRLRNSAYRRRQQDVLINWGNTDPPYTEGVLNGRGIRAASNKLEFFRLMEATDRNGIIPRWWTNAADIPDGAFPIVCRTELAGHSGAGIVIAERRDQLVRAPLYVQYVKKTEEYRIHVGRTRTGPVIISEQQKRRSREVPDEQVNWQVRNVANGFIYARENLQVPDSVRLVAREALRATNLDFGAVDVIYHNGGRNGTPYAKVLEINTAPGITGTTVTDYVRFFNGAR